MPLPLDPSDPFHTSPGLSFGGGGGYGGELLPVEGPSLPGGRPPGYLIGPDGQPMQAGPATPQPGAAPPLNANAASGGGPGLVTSALALAASAGLVALGVYLYKDHAEVTLARNGGAADATAKKRGKRASKRRNEDDDDEEMDDDA